MHKPIHLLAAVCCAMTSLAQQTDTLVIFYKTDKYQLTKQDKQKLDSFLLRGWDRLWINGYTDETDEIDYNLELSEKRSGEVYAYCLSKDVPSTAVHSQFFGESRPQASNGSEDGRALNRRTEIIGYQFPKVKVKPAAVAPDPMLPVTHTLNNGFIITYRPGTLPGYLADNFASGSGENFQLLTNTTEMRQNNLYNNTTRGEILSSVLIVCGSKLNPCKLDSPVLVRLPIPFNTNCPIEKVKFFNAVAERGKQIWQEQSKELYPEVIDGVKYIRLWIDDFCSCINFDFKVDPECYPTDSTKVFYVNGTIRNVTAEIMGLNSLYMPRRINDSTFSIIFLKDKLKQVPISFALYRDKKRVRGYRDKLLTDFPYDSLQDRYVLSSGTEKFHFPKLDVWDVVLKVNNDRYRVAEDNGRYEFTYLKYRTDSILVDFTVIESKKRMTLYKNQPLSLFPVDPQTGYRIIDKKFIRELKLARSVAAK